MGEGKISFKISICLPRKTQNRRRPPRKRKGVAVKPRRRSGPREKSGISSTISSCSTKPLTTSCTKSPFLQVDHAVRRLGEVEDPRFPGSIRPPRVGDERIDPTRGQTSLPDHLHAYHQGR